MPYAPPPMKRLAEWLAEQELDQAEFAARMGVHQATVSRWLKGLRTPSASQYERLMAKTGLTFEELRGTKPRKGRAETVSAR
jgi:transcriptional regulator with XRE-family HTH domain